MAIQAKKQNPWFVVVILVAGVALWALDQRKELSSPTPKETRQAAPPASPPSEKSSRKGGYEIFHNCTLAEDRTNDGDSFRILLPDGRREVFRLYYVDTPESAFKRYANGDTNHARIRDQANYFGISPEEAVEIGKAGKKFTHELLGAAPFTVQTKWDDPFGDHRYHAFILVSPEKKPRFLHEQLVGKGLARLKTKPAPLPDGTSVEQHRRFLESLQSEAKRNRVGGWKK
jgi:endonuclease YncB( thermonuclease family)